MIGLSGLITPSLDEMVHVAREMERQEFALPLLIGGATTSRAHTAVKIAPHYSQPVVHVVDASRAVGVVSSLLSDELRPDFQSKMEADYERLRMEHASRNQDKKLIPLEQARANRTAIDWAGYEPPRPEARRDDSHRGALAGHAGGLHRLVALLSHLGIARAVSGHLRRSRPWPAGAGVI